MTLRITDRLGNTLGYIAPVAGAGSALQGFLIVLFVVVGIPLILLWMILAFIFTSVQHAIYPVPQPSTIATFGELYPINGSCSSRMRHPSSKALAPTPLTPSLITGH